MRYATDQAFRMALEDRIRRTTSAPGGSSRLRKRIIFERLLARLVTRAPGDWVLKGGFALELRLGDVARATKDADFEWRLDDHDATDLLLDAAALDLGDRFTFALERTTEATDLPGGGQRWRLVAYLARRTFERAVIDIAFNAAPVQTPDQVVTSDLLSFAGITAVQVPTVGIEQHLAEKLHAYTRVYSHGRTNTRVKDLVDIAVIANTSTINASQLNEAIRTIFDRRGEQSPPHSVPPPPSTWARPWNRLVRDLPASEDMAAGHAIATTLFNPVLAETRTDGLWQPDSGWTS